MTTIRETVQNTMQRSSMSQYVSQAEPVITALEQRERRAIQTLTSLATQRGISQAECQQALRQAGLDQGWQSQQGQEMQTPADQQGAQFGNEPSQYTGAQTGQPGDVSQQISDLQNQVRALQEAARNAGVQF